MGAYGPGTYVSTEVAIGTHTGDSSLEFLIRAEAPDAINLQSLDESITGAERQFA
jgi:hypothetical protein